MFSEILGGACPLSPPLATPVYHSSPVATGGVWGLSLPHKAPSPPKLKHETL